MKPASLRRSISLLLVVSLLAPGMGSAQAPPATQAPAPPPAPVPPAPTATTRPAPSFPSPPTRGATPGADYRLGPGDVLDVQITGRLEVIRQQTVVDLEGTVNVPPIGAVPVGGITLLEAHRRIAARARDVFRFAEASITVVSPRTFELIVSGEVERPGTLQVTATRRLHDAILESGGITPRGSLRRVLVTRKGVESEMDLLAFQLRGDVTQNPFVEEGVRIHVPARAGSVTLAGAVRRPGEYELGSTPSLRLSTGCGRRVSIRQDGCARLRQKVRPLRRRHPRLSP